MLLWSVSVHFSTLVGQKDSINVYSLQGGHATTPWGVGYRDRSWSSWYTSWLDGLTMSPVVEKANGFVVSGPEHRA